jgi:hypothetical protein
MTAIFALAFLLRRSCRISVTFNSIGDFSKRCKRVTTCFAVTPH